MNSPRDQWSSSVGFVLAAAGSAIGLGNLWKFPFITWENEGGAFVLVYLLCIAAVGLPIMMAEVLIGRKTQKSAVGALKEAVGPIWGIVGGWGVLSGLVILSFYAVVAGWSVYYFLRTLQWSITGFPEDLAAGDFFGAFVGNGSLQLLFAALFMGLTVGIVVVGIARGIERVARIFLPILGGILILMLVSALTMDGAGEALTFIFAPRFDALDRSGVLEALGHSFFTLSLGMGAMITYGSYLGRDQSVVAASAAIVLLDTVIALVATVIMFSVIFSVPGMADQVGQSTAGMLFISLPELFFNVVPFGRVLGPLFYLLVALAALTSTISLLEVVAAYFIDERGMARRKAVLISGGTIFSVTILAALSLGAVPALSGFELFEGKAGMFSTLDHFAANWMLPTGGLLITLAAGWLMTRDSTQAELVDEMTPSWFSYEAWRFFIRFVAPVAVGAILISVMFFGGDFT
ncbi:MAG: sodium-dependent transporter [Gemmatimonadetes bacterium]|nr:sodium-dependent transporter [Gemmatimonadota bacterium]